MRTHLSHTEGEVQMGTLAGDTAGVSLMERSAW